MNVKKSSSGGSHTTVVIEKGRWILSLEHGRDVRYCHNLDVRSTSSGFGATKARNVHLDT